MAEKKIVAKLSRLFSSTKGNGWSLGKLVVGDHNWFTCEDEYRKVKVPKETRLRAGIWELTLNTTGGKNVKYKEIMGAAHIGMIEILTPDFLATYIHIGNDESNTEGCPLVGKTMDKGSGKVGQSTIAYKEMYPILSKIIKNAHAAGTKVYIEISDDGEIKL